MSKAQMDKKVFSVNELKDQIEALVLDKDILENDLYCKEKLIAKLRWFCLKLSVDLSEDEAVLTKEVALILLNSIDDDTEHMSFNEFILD